MPLSPPGKSTSILTLPAGAFVVGPVGTVTLVHTVERDPMTPSLVVEVSVGIPTTSYKRKESTQKTIVV